MGARASRGGGRAGPGSNVVESLSGAAVGGSEGGGKAAPPLRRAASDAAPAKRPRYRPPRKRSGGPGRGYLRRVVRHSRSELNLEQCDLRSDDLAYLTSLGASQVGGVRSLVLRGNSVTRLDLGGERRREGVRGGGGGAGRGDGGTTAVADEDAATAAEAEAEAEPAVWRSLERVDLSDNVDLQSVEGIAPVLRRLRVLRLCGVALGRVPPQLLDAGRLEDLDLSHNQLRVLPPDLARLTRLRRLNVSHNSLSALPQRLAECGELRTLLASHNQLRRLPAALLDEPDADGLLLATRLPPGLVELDVSNNFLADLGTALAGLARLERLDASFNSLSRLSPAVGRAARLQFVAVHCNQLEALPAEIGRLGELHTLLAHNNRLVELPPEIGGASQLRVLNLSSNSLQALPAGFGGLERLADLNLCSNSLAEAPPELERLGALRSLDLGFNRIESVPAGFLGGARRLAELGMWGNPMPVPADLFSLSADDLRAYFAVPAEEREGVYVRLRVVRGARDDEVSSASSPLPGAPAAGRHPRRLSRALTAPSAVLNGVNM